MKYNGGCPKDEIDRSSLEYLNNGICNLESHILNLKKFTNHILVVLNQFSTDTKEEIDFVKDFVSKFNCEFEICNSYQNGSLGATEVAKKVILLSNQSNAFKFLYSLNDSITNKIETVCKEIYHANNIIYSDEAINQIKKFEKLNFNHLPICIAKTQYSFSDDPKKLGNPIQFSVTVQNIELRSGAGFIIVFLGSIIDMPGLPKKPNAIHIKIDDNENISGLF